MATLSDHQQGMALESTWKTAVTPTRFYPWFNTTTKWEPLVISGSATRPAAGRRAMLLSRRIVDSVGGSGSVTVELEAETRGMGMLYHLGMGASTVTAITGGSQQNFTYAITGSYLPSATFQAAKVNNLGAFSVETYAGCTASKLAWKQADGEVLQVSLDLNAEGMTLATAMATAVMPSTQAVFSAKNASVTLGGTVTAPTTTALATGGTATCQFKSFDIEVNQNLGESSARLCPARKAQPVAGSPEVMISAEIAWEDMAIRDAFLAGTPMPLTITYTSEDPLGTGFHQLQFYAPNVVIDADGLADVKPGEETWQSPKMKVMSSGSGVDFQVSYRTSDTAL